MDKTEHYLERARLKHSNRYEYDVTTPITNVDTKFTAICVDHGQFETTARTHITKGCGCPACGRLIASNSRRNDKSTFISRAKLIHGAIYDYSDVDYVNNRVPVKIGCPTHGAFYQRPVKHSSAGAGCPKCSLTRGRQEFIDKSTTVHCGRYSYNDVEYTSSRHHVTVKCATHGPFQITPNNHLRGYGCHKCALLYCNGGYSVSTLQDSPIGRLLGTLYVLDIQTNQERFIKIGITKRDVTSRFPLLKDAAVDACLIQDISLYEAYLTEQSILARYSHRAYVPVLLKGNGSTECFEYDSGLHNEITSIILDSQKRRRLVSDYVEQHQVNAVLPWAD